MAWGNSSYYSWGFRALLDYADAVQWEANVKPIRGDVNNTKPLGNRRKKHINIKKDPTTQDIVVNFGCTEIVRYKPNGDVIINNGGWVSASTHEFLWALLRLPMRTFDGKAWVKCFYQPKDQDMGTLIPIERPVATAGEYILPNNTPVKFRLDPISNQWVSSELAMPFTHKVNREKANLVRKSYANFKRYLSGIVKLRTEVREKSYWGGQTETERVVVISGEELSQHRLRENSNNSVLRFNNASDELGKKVRNLMLSDNADDNYKAFLYIVRGQYAYGYVPNTGIAVYSDAVFEFYNRMLLFIHKHEVLDKEPMGTDHAKRDPYGAWFM